MEVNYEMLYFDFLEVIFHLRIKFYLEIVPRSIKLILIFAIAIIFFYVITPSILDYSYD